jgi:hypothetical protein
MGYSNFKKIKTVVKKFDLTTQWLPLFGKIEPVEPSSWLTETLEMAKLFPLLNEKTKAERVVSPILLEVSKPYKDKITFFSGEDLNVNVENDLSGECDFLFALHPPQSFVDAPIISLVESKDEDMEWGVAQCAAQLYGAKLYNEAEGKNIPVLYGCATDGLEWQFIRFNDNVFYIDDTVYTDLRQILGVWKTIIEFYVKPSM